LEIDTDSSEKHAASIFRVELIRLGVRPSLGRAMRIVVTQNCGGERTLSGPIGVIK
jgi:hypothetical protein